MPDSANLEGLFVRLYFDRHIMAGFGRIKHPSNE